MNKYLILLISLAFMFFTGCKKEQEEFSLVGKTYAGFSNSVFGEFDTYRSWRFISETEVEGTYRKDSPTGPFLTGSEIEMGTYTLSYPKLIITFNEKYDGEQTYHCEFISGTCFRVSLYDDELTEFHQQ